MGLGGLENPVRGAARTAPDAGTELDRMGTLVQNVLPTTPQNRYAAIA